MLLRWVLEADNGSLQQVVLVLKKGMKSKRMRNCRTVFAVTDDSLLRRAWTEQAYRALRACRDVQTCAASGARVAQRCSTLVRKRAFSPIFLNESIFLQCVLA